MNYEENVQYGYVPNVLPPPGGYAKSEYMQAPDTTSWYSRRQGCLKGVDPTEIARMYTFPDGRIPMGIPMDPAAASKICLGYVDSRPPELVDADGMMEAARNHPQFAFRAGGPGTPYQIDVESQLRRLDQPLGNCQAIIPEDAPLYVNTVAPPPVSGVAYGVQNASNPVAAIVTEVGAETCRIQADTVASAMSGRRFNNPTRQDTMRFDRPFAPPGIGTGEPRPRQPLGAGQAFYA